jgi:hypothetical protein
LMIRMVKWYPRELRRDVAQCAGGYLMPWSPTPAPVPLEATIQRSGVPRSALFGLTLALCAWCLSGESSLGQVSWEVFPVAAPEAFFLAPDVEGRTYVWRSGTRGSYEIRMWTEGDPAPTVLAARSDVGLPRIGGGRVAWDGADGLFHSPPGTLLTAPGGPDKVCWFMGR